VHFLTAGCRTERFEVEFNKKKRNLTLKEKERKNSVEKRPNGLKAEFNKKTTDDRKTTRENW
jgi:hypothetical protein